MRPKLLIPIAAATGLIKEKIILIVVEMLLFPKKKVKAYWNKKKILNNKIEKLYITAATMLPVLARVKKTVINKD